MTAAFPLPGLLERLPDRVVIHPFPGIALLCIEHTWPFS
jgi:hypothetical protein